MKKADVDYCDTYSFLHLGVRELTEQRAFNAPTNQMNADQIIQRAELPLHGVPGCGHMNQCPGGHPQNLGALGAPGGWPGGPRAQDIPGCGPRAAGGGLGAAAALGGAAGALAGGGALGGPNSLAQAAGLGGAAGMMGLSGSLAPGGMGPCGGLGQCGVPPCVTSAALAAADALWPPSSPAHHQHSQIGGALGGPNPLGGANSLPMGGPMGGAYGLLPGGPMPGWTTHTNTLGQNNGAGDGGHGGIGGGLGRYHPETAGLPLHPALGGGGGGNGSNKQDGGMPPPSHGLGAFDHQLQQHSNNEPTSSQEDALQQQLRSAQQQIDEQEGVDDLRKAADELESAVSELKQMLPPLMTPPPEGV